MTDRRQTPQPLTQEQLDWVTAQTERAAAKAAAQAAEKAAEEGVRKGRKQQARQARIGFIILLLGILLVFHLGNRASDGERQAIVDSGKVVSVDGCNRDYTEDVRIRDVFLTSRSIIKNRLEAGESADPQADKAAVRFYDEQLLAFKLPDCRRAEALLTSDPDRFVPDIEPFYPGNPNAPQSVYSQGQKQDRPG
jgi:hypothetical protein